MTSIIKTIFLKGKELFEAYGGEETRETFYGEFNYESGKLFFIILLTLFVWIPYIPNDLKLHQYPIFPVCIRIGLSVLSFLLIMSRFTKRFRYNPCILLMILAGYLYLGTAFVTATSGENAASYIGGFAFVIMIPVFAPIPLKFKISIAIVAFVMFFGVGTLAELDFAEVSIKYAVNDLFSSLIVSLLMSYTQNILRYNAWEQRHKLAEMIAQDEKNLATIFSLAGKAEMASKAKSEFLTTMSHEIRTPMNAILGISEIQMQRRDLDSELWEALDKIRNSGQTLLSIINDILDLSKIETGKLELNPAEYDVPSFINDTVSLNMVRIGSKPIEFKLDISEDFPQRLIGDELRLKQVLNNLLSNAFKYTEKGTVTLSASSTKTAENEMTLCFKVSDTGQGMKPEDVEKLFTKYSRFNAEANRTTEGTGLGLSITKTLVTMMGGDIQVESDYGQGSAFTVKVIQEYVNDNIIGATLAKKLCEFSYSHNNRSEQLRIDREYMSHGSVLVVDDVETNLYVAKGFLLPYGLKIETAISGFEAIDKIKGGAIYDIVFMDHMMPEMDGIETVKKLRDMGYAEPIVALTANAITGNDVMFKENGFEEFISKPIDIRQLDEVLNRFISKGHKRIEDVTEIMDAHEAMPEPDFEIEGIDVKVGIRNVGGKRENYIKTLEIFCKDADARLTEIPKSLENGENKLFTTHTHAIKSASANIGALELSEMAKKLEAAGNSQDEEYIRENVGAFLDSLGRIKGKITKYLSEETLSKSEKNENPEEIRQNLKKLRAALINIDISAINEIADEISKFQTLSIAEEISQKVLLSDYDSAIAVIDEYLAE